MVRRSGVWVCRLCPEACVCVCVCACAAPAFSWMCVRCTRMMAALFPLSSLLTASTSHLWLCVEPLPPHLSLLHLHMQAR